MVRIENGADVASLLGTEHEPLAGRPLRVLVVAGDFERKGVAVAIAAIARTDGCVLRVVGNGDLDAMRALAERLGASERVALRGFRDDMPAEYQWADVVLSCSSHESFGLSLVEGAAAGCAIVCTATGVGPSFCEDDGNGAGGHVVVADAAQIAGLLDALASDPAACRAMGAVAAHRATRFSWDDMAARTLDLYGALRAAAR